MYMHLNDIQAISKPSDKSSSWEEALKVFIKHKLQHSEKNYENVLPWNPLNPTQFLKEMSDPLSLWAAEDLFFATCFVHWIDWLNQIYWGGT